MPGSRSDPYVTITTSIAVAGTLASLTITALLSAIAKAESSYNPRAQSHAGAQGLMQLMPNTASLIARRNGRSAGSLTDASNNLRLGQDYVGYLLETRTVSQDLLRMVALDLKSVMEG